MKTQAGQRTKYKIDVCVCVCVCERGQLQLKAMMIYIRGTTGRAECEVEWEGVRGST